MANGARLAGIVLNRFVSRWRMTPLRSAMQVLPSSDQKKIVAATLIQISMSALDLIGVLAIGLLGALSVTGLQSNAPGDRVSAALRFLHVSNASFETQASIIGGSAILLLVGRTLLSIYFTRKIMFFFSRRGATISANLTSRLLSQQLLLIQSRTIQERLFAITGGVQIITLQVLATAVVLTSDISLLIIMTIGLFILDPYTAVVIFILFSLVGILLYKIMHVRAGRLGSLNSLLNIQSNEKIVEVFSSFRESVVRNRRDYYAREIGKKRFEIADNAAEMNFMPYVSKYVIETAVILGALLISFMQLILQDATHAVATLAIFLASGSRIAPAVLRLQQGMLTIRGGLGQAQLTLNLIDELGDSPIIEDVNDTVDTLHRGFNAVISVSNVSLTYPGKPTPAISDVSFEVPKGTSAAFVGPSGAGKTTLIDILLGVLNADSGKVLISGLSPLSTIAKWPGAISYVPQDVIVVAGTIRENIALGYPPEAATDELVMSALKLANLDKFIEQLPDGVDTQVGERGSKISGGQKQRLGIARAMFTQPQLLVLDEATSSLDGMTEASISEDIQALRGSTTVVIIAHRLSTVRNADKVFYLSEGKILAEGTFKDVREAVPEFDRQATIMGL